MATIYFRKELSREGEYQTLKQHTSQRIESMSLGLHVATSLSMILLAISKQLLDNPANFVTAFGNSNESASIIACQTTKKIKKLSNESQHLLIRITKTESM